MDRLVDPKSLVAINAFCVLSSLCAGLRLENRHLSPSCNLSDWLDVDDFVEIHHSITKIVNAVAMPLREMLSQSLSRC
jgi:hypothetical protein